MQKHPGISGRDLISNVPPGKLPPPAFIAITRRSLCGPLIIANLCTQECEVQCIPQIKAAANVCQSADKPAGMYTSLLKGEQARQKEEASTSKTTPNKKEIGNDPFGSLLNSLTK